MSPVLSGAQSQPENKEDTCMSAQNPVAEVAPINAGELTSVGDLEVQAADAVNVVTVASEYFAVLSEWVGSLPDRYASAGFATGGLTQAVATVGEAMPQANTLTAMAEALAALLKEAENTAALAEAAESLDASGDISAFRAT
jgi:hypothetical protein